MSIYVSDWNYSEFGDVAGYKNQFNKTDHIPTHRLQLKISCEQIKNLRY